MIDIQSFILYLENLPHQTFQMQDKKVLRVKRAHSQNIVAMATSNTAYIDEEFYSKRFGENKKNQNYKSFPVEVTSLPVQWILTSQEGKEFL